MFTDSVTDALSKINELALIGFGSFFVSDVPAREGRNPKTYENCCLQTNKIQIWY